MRTLFFCVITIVSSLVHSKEYAHCPPNRRPIPCNPTCCFDTIKCEDINNHPPYLGADSVTRVHSGHMTGIHVSYRFYSVQFKKVSRYLQPQQDSMLGYWHPKPQGLDGLEPYTVFKTACQGRSSKSDWGTGCSTRNESHSNVVATLFWKNAYILVCDGLISRANYVWDLPEFCPIKVGNVFPTPYVISRKDNCINTEYHPLCHLPDLNLIDAFSLPDGNGSEIMVAYYGESQITDPGGYSREYRIYTWDGKHMKREGDKVMGQLSAIDIFEIEKDDKGKPKVAYGLYFTNSGQVCPFKHIIGDKNYNFEHSEPPIRIPCRSLQTFIACPQAWCVDAFVDASFTVTDNGKKEHIYLTLFKNMWILEAKPLPLDVPLVKDHILIDQAIDEKCIYRYPTEERRKYYEGKNIFKCVIADALAAFVVTVDGQEFMFNLFGYKKRNNWHIVAKGRRYLLQTEKSLKDFFPGMYLPDAAWYDKVSKLLYLFKGSSYKTYKLRTDLVDQQYKFSSIPVGNGTTKDLGLIYDGEPEDGIGAVISMNGSNYFFNQRFRFMEIKDGDKSVIGGPRFIQKDFFRVKSQCYYNDLDSWTDLLAKNGEPIEKIVKFKIHGGYSFKSTRKFKDVNSTPVAWIVAIIIAGAIVAFIGLITMFLNGGKNSKIYATTIVKKYERRNGRKQRNERHLSAEDSKPKFRPDTRRRHSVGSSRPRAGQMASPKTLHRSSSIKESNSLDLFRNEKRNK